MALDEWHMPGVSGTIASKGTGPFLNQNDPDARLRFINTQGQLGDDDITDEGHGFMNVRAGVPLAKGLAMYKPSSELRGFRSGQINATVRGDSASPVTVHCQFRGLVQQIVEDETPGSTSLQTKGFYELAVTQDIDTGDITLQFQARNLARSESAGPPPSPITPPTVVSGIAFGDPFVVSFEWVLDTDDLVSNPQPTVDLRARLAAGTDYSALELQTCATLPYEEFEAGGVLETHAFLLALNNQDNLTLNEPEVEAFIMQAGHFDNIQFHVVGLSDLTIPILSEDWEPPSSGTPSTLLAEDWEPPSLSPSTILAEDWES